MCNKKDKKSKSRTIYLELGKNSGTLTAEWLFGCGSF